MNRKHGEFTIENAKTKEKRDSFFLYDLPA
jgi:hypothetical protein